MTIQPTNPGQNYQPGQHIQRHHQRQLLAAWVQVAVAMLNRDIEDMHQLREACEVSGTFDQVQRISYGIEELTDARRQLLTTLDELMPIVPPPEAGP